MSYAANKQTDRQTNKQTDSKILPTPTDIVSVGNYGSAAGEISKDTIIIRDSLVVDENGLV